MNNVGIPRRDMMTYGGATLAGLALLQAPFLARAFPVRPGEEVIPWADQPPPHARPQVVPRQLRWEEFDCCSRQTIASSLLATMGFRLSIRRHGR